MDEPIPKPRLQTSTLHSSEERIKVFVRVRPLVEREIFQQGNNDVATTVDVLDNRVQVKARSGTSKCVVDGVFPPTTQQAEVYAQVRDCVMSVTEGFNATCFAYGQTGSGKTFTMFGDERHGDIYSSNASVPESAGVIPRAVRDVLSYSRTKGEACTCYVSFMQIYNEQVFDLLRDPTRTVGLNVKEDSRLGIYVEGLSEFAVESEHDVLRLLRVGDNRRAVRATRMNDMSSRSHSVFQMVLEQRHEGEEEESQKSTSKSTSKSTPKMMTSKKGNKRKSGGVIRSKLNLVDLAGSEKWNVHQDIAQAHISELTNINLSLHTLGRCIEALAKPSHTYVPYRESKLTRLLQDSLGGSAKTRLFAMMSPSELSAEEAQATLRFADCAKRVMQHVTIKETRAIDHVLVARLEREVQELRQKLAEQKKGGGSGGSGGGSGGSRSLTLDVSQVQSNLSSHTNPSSPKAPSSSLSFQPPNEQQQEPAVKVIASAAVLEQLDKYKKKCVQLEHVLENIDQCANRFFRFEIEEEQMESEMKEHLHRSKTLRRDTIESLLPSSHISSMRSKSSRKGMASNTTKGGKNRNGAKIVDVLSKSSSSSGMLSPSNVLLPRKMGSKATPTIGMKFRIRGGPGSGAEMPMGEEEKERELEARLKDANRKMTKQKKLQEWLADKARKEQAALDEQIELEDARRKAIEDAERIRRERNKENKAKLSSWRQQQIDELNALLGSGGEEGDDGDAYDGERPPPDW